ncbi:MAG: GTPase [Candidatus Woesearchaeota archaeon]
MANFWNIVDKVINEADIVLEVIDARMIEETRNLEIERKVEQRNKILIRVINKCDLVDKETLEKEKKRLYPCVFISAKNFLGTTILRQKILRYSKGGAILVGVVGYPNTGKSSLINCLKGKGSAKVSSVSGYTKGKQEVKADNRIKLIDTPGVLSDTNFLEDNNVKIATKNFYDEKDPDVVVLGLITKYRTGILNHYDVKCDGDEEEVLEAIAKKLNRMKSGGKPDVEIAAKLILKEWQHGKIKV